MANFGSGSALLGGTSALSQAMSSRGMDTSVLNQMSPASAGGAPPIPAPLPPQTPPSPVGPNVSSNTPTSVMGTGGPSSEAELILKALTGRLSTLSKNGF